MVGSRMLSEHRSKHYQLVVALVTAFGLLIQYDVFALSWLIEPLFLLGMVGSAWLLALDALITLVRRRPARHLWSALVLAICVGPAFPWVHVPFCWVSAAHKLWRSEGRYVELIQRAQAGDEDHELYRIEAGPPTLYSFAWGGIADNWYGVVHDASRTFDRAGEDVLGGNLVFEMHLWGPWYFVQFT